MPATSEVRAGSALRNDLDALWMPFTANRQFKARPRFFVGAKDMHYTTDDGRKVLDGTAGLWCVNAGHARPRIVEAVQRQIAELDYAPVFQMGHPKEFELANLLLALAPPRFEQVFFTNSGSEGVDTALKIALAFHQAKGQGQRFRIIGRERGYHGAGFGGISVGGLPANRRTFGPLLPGVDHIRHTHDLSRNTHSRGQPACGVEFADDFERVITLHDPSTIAALIVEPVAGSAGVLIPPRGYLERLRALCDQHGILLIFDEVITGFGRLGAPFAAEFFGVVPDLMVTAKGLSNGCVPMGCVFVGAGIYDAFMQGPEHIIELFHGYTYSGHPLACAAALATLDTYEEQGLLRRASELSEYWADAIHSLKDHPNVIDTRSIGLAGAVELSPRPGAPGKRAYDAFIAAFEDGILVRTTGDIIAMSPPLIVSKAQIDELVGKLGHILKTLT